MDDVDVNRAVLAGTFMDEYHIVEKENGQVAWEYLEQNYKRVKIVMLDLLMPVMDGFQLLDKIKSDVRTKDIPVIITSQGDADSERRALQVRADDHIVRPYKPDIIRHKVHNALASHEQKQVEKPGTIPMDKAQQYIAALRPHFDIVRLVDPRQTMICDNFGEECEIQSCFSVWGRQQRCSNCISLKALEGKTRMSKLEYTSDGLYCVISEYVPFEGRDAVLEMVTRLDSEYIDNVFDKIKKCFI